MAIGLWTFAAIRWQLGDVATWIGGVGTAAALLLTYALLRLSRSEHSAEAADARLAQARKVSAWSVGVTVGNPLDMVDLKLRNASDEPIYGTRVAVGRVWEPNRCSGVIGCAPVTERAGEGVCFQPRLERQLVGGIQLGSITPASCVLEVWGWNSVARSS